MKRFPTIIKNKNRLSSQTFQAKEPFTFHSNKTVHGKTSVRQKLVQRVMIHRSRYSPLQDFLTILTKAIRVSNASLQSRSSPPLPGRFHPGDPAVSSTSSNTEERVNKMTELQKLSKAGTTIIIIILTKKHTWSMLSDIPVKKKKGQECQYFSIIKKLTMQYVSHLQSIKLEHW